jgi:hypothetical protein
MYNSIIKLSLFLSVFLLCSCYKDNEEELYQNYLGNCDLTTISFKADIAPIFEATCDKCHDEANNATAGNKYNLDGYENIKTFELKYSGAILGSIQHKKGYNYMPKFSRKLDNCNIAKIETWIKDGMPNN